MAMNKRGIFFTTLALVFILIILFLASSQEKLLTRASSEGQRIHTMDVYVSSMEEDMSRATYIAGFRSLIGLEEHVSASGEYLPDFDAAFMEMFVNGTYNGTQYAIMDDSTFTDFTASFATLARTQGIVTDVEVLDVDAYHTSPWEVTVNVTVALHVSDTARTASFDRTTVVTTAIPIESIKDPLYTVGTRGRAPHTVQQSTLAHPYITAANDTSTLQRIVNSTFYVASPQGPTFIQRFTGNLSPSQNGIASLVKISELQAQDIPVSTCRSVVDYLYFGTANTDNYRIVNMDSNTFWLDINHLDLFDATNKVTGTKPCT
jgi:hypothetical protein